MVRCWKVRIVLHVAIAVGLICATRQLTAQDALKAWLARITAPDTNVRQAAWQEACKYGPAAIVPLGKLMASADKSVARAARLAMERIVYAAAAPGAEKQRIVASRALCRLLSTDQPRSVQATEIRFLAMVGSDEAVPVLAELLDDPEVGEDARQALDRIPAKAAGQALLEALERAKGERKIGLILALAHRGDMAAVPKLLELTADADSDVRIAAIDGLARLGDMRAGTAITRALGSRIERERNAAADGLLRLAQIRLQAGNEQLARHMYERVLRSNARIGARVAALRGLRRIADSASLQAVLHSLDTRDPVFRETALGLIDELAGAQAASAMLRAYRTASPRARVGLLLALAARDDGTVAPTLLQALDDPEAEIQAAAATGLGLIMHQEAAEALLTVAEKGKEPAKSAALNSYLKLLTARLAREKSPELLPLLNHALGIAAQDRERKMALEALAAYGDPSSLALVEPLTKCDGAREAALQAYVAIGKTLAAKGNREPAASIFRKAIARGASLALAKECAEQLKELGLSINLAKAAGFITDWWLIDHFPNKDKRGFDEVFPPEKEIDLDRGVIVHDQPQTWQVHHTDHEQGIVLLERIFQPNTDRVAYAYAVISVPQEQDVTLKIGSDDAVKCWINGELVHANNAYRPITVDEDRAQAHLKAGENQVLMKVIQGGGHWSFCLRLVGEDGEAVAFEQVSPVQ